jgi:hypothetical protein
MPELDFRTMQTLPQRVKRSRKNTPTESPSARSSTVPRPGGRSSSPRWGGPMPFGCRGVARRRCRDHVPTVTGAAPCVARLRLAEGAGDHDQCPPQPCQRSSFDRSTRAPV